MRLLSIIFVSFAIVIFLPSCGSSKIKNPETVEEAEKMLAKKQAKEAKDAKQFQKEAFKAHHDRQSKAYKKSLKANEKRNKKMMKQQKKR